MSIQQEKDKFKTSLEKNIQRFTTNTIGEQTIDYVVMAVRRNKIPVDGEVLATIMEYVRQGISDNYYNGIDRALGDIDQSLEVFLENTNPLVTTNSKPKSEGANQTTEAKVEPAPKEAPKKRGRPPKKKLD